MMKENTCLNCGKTILSDRKKSYCNNRCYKSYWQRSKRAEEKEQRATAASVESVCIINEGVICSQHNCTTCGWNPIVTRQRLAARRME